MRFENTYEFQAAIPPGRVLWATGFKLARHSDQVIRNLPPCRVEACCQQNNDEDEARHRAKNRSALYIVPLDDKNKRLFERSVLQNDLSYFETKEEAEAHYQRELETAVYEVRCKILTLQEFELRLCERQRKAAKSAQKKGD